MFKRLQTPGKIGSLKIKNRMIMAPMAMQEPDKGGFINDRMIEYYVERAKGGVGLITTVGFFVTPSEESIPSIWDDKFIPGLKRLVDTIHKAGSKVALQLATSGGRVDFAHPNAASDMPGEVPRGTWDYLKAPYKKPKIVTTADLDEWIERHTAAALRAQEAGADAIQIHGAGPYLVADLLSPWINNRTDKYGGDFKGRAKYCVDLVQTARKKLGKDFPIIYKFSADQRLDGGFALSDGVLMAQMIEEAGADALDVVSGAFSSTCWYIPTQAHPDACNRQMSAAIKGAINIPVFLGGKIDNPFLAEDILERGDADFISLGRPLIADPEFPNKVVQGRAEDIRKCLFCHVCFQRVIWSMDDLLGRSGGRCTVNPRAGRENIIKTAKPARSLKKVLVIGGGPAGMEAARTAAIRGHQVTLWEKSDKLGGLLNLAMIPPHKETLNTLLEWDLTQLRKLPVTIELGREANPATVVAFAPDVVIVATGSNPLIPDIPGLEENRASKVMTALEVLEGKKLMGEWVVVIGGELVGCETAEYLADKGKKVIITRRGDLMAVDVPGCTRTLLLRRLEEKGVILMPRVKYEEVTQAGLVISSGGSRKTLLRADTIILAAGSNPNEDLYLTLKGRVPECYRIGDCAKPRHILEAVEEGMDVASKI
jgi:2,4-dienoyl-CoA reductase-like NADH-dependent reductase (Old Yellow Enzyme family)/thioredoxin reductase